VLDAEVSGVPPRPAILPEMGIVVDAWERFLEPFLGRVWDSPPFWQGASLLLLTALVGMTVCRRALAEWVLGLGTRDNDLTIFTKFDAEAPESFMDDLFNQRLYNGWFTTSDIEKVGVLGEGLARIENRYLNVAMADAAAAFLTVLNQFRRFSFGRFWPIGNDVFKFYPERIERERYEREWSQLQIYLSDVWEAYRQYRLTAKQVLKV
jgi:hypothetical protein